MPGQNRQSAHHALEFLEDYYRTLKSPDDAGLKDAIDRLTSIFKSRLFQALMDIQDFCEVILNDSTRSFESKVTATHKLADQWESKSPFLSPRLANEPEDEFPRHNGIEGSRVQQTKCPGSTLPFLRRELSTSCVLSQNSGEDVHCLPFDYSNHWVTEEVVLQRTSSVGLGFSIAGGVDAPCIPNDTSIFVTRITPAGLADRDGRLRVHDSLLNVNNVSFLNISHSTAVETLKRAGDNVVLQVKRLNPPHVTEISLIHSNRGLGMSISGGINTELIAGDHGIFVTHIKRGGPADLEGSLVVGDRLIMVQTPKSDYDLTFVEHRQARDYINQACADSDGITLIVGHPSNLVCEYDVDDDDDMVLTNAQSGDRAGLFAGVGGNVSHLTTNLSNGSTPAAVLDIADTVCEDGKRDTRRVVLKKDPREGFGFKIVGGDDIDGGIFISFILTGGPADLSKKLKKGDQILSVNNIDLRHATHDEAGLTLKNCGTHAELVVRHRPEEFTRSEARAYDRREQILEATSEDMKTGMSSSGGGRTASGTNSMGGTLRTAQKRQFYVRTNFDYDPLKDSGLPGRGLSFKRNDILHVTNAADDDWWQARRVDSVTGKDEDLGIVPSQQRIERKEKSRARKVIFGKTEPLKYGASLDRRKKKRFGLFSKEKKEVTSGDETDNDHSEDPVFYEVVIQKTINYARPIVILGPFKDQINEDLIQDYPDRFGICVPHTTRASHDDEVDGKDYHFVQSREQMEQDIQNRLFIEAGQYNSNLYGTSVAAVRSMAEQGKHCVLDVSQYAIRRLQMSGLYPIAILVKPKSVENLLELNKHMTMEQADKLLEKNHKMETDYGDYFTGFAEGDNYDEILACVKTIILQNSGNRIWLPSGEAIDQ